MNDQKPSTRTQLKGSYLPIMSSSIPILLFVCGQLAHANAGIPMLAISWPVLWLAFVPVVAVETLLLSNLLGLTLRQLIKPVCMANIKSTLVGIPVAWFLMFLVKLSSRSTLLFFLPEYVTSSEAFRYASFPLEVAWIEGRSILEFNTAFVVLMVVFCWMSVACERQVLTRYLPNVAKPVLRRAVNRVNIVSYILICIVTLIVTTLVG